MIPAMRRRTQIALGATLAALVLAAVVLRMLATRFHAQVAQAKKDLAKSTATGPRPQLPAIALEYLARAGVASNGSPRVVRIAQQGELRRSPDGDWTPFSAVQRLAVRDVGFVWHARMKVGPGVGIEILDQLTPESASTELRLLGAIPLSDAGCEHLERAGIQRYLTELAWAPHAIRDNPALQFRSLGDRKLEVAVGEGKERASVELELDAQGDIIRSVAMRPRIEKGAVVPRRWVAELSKHGQLGAVRVPTYGEARWELPSGRFVYFRGQVQSLEID